MAKGTAANASKTLKTKHEVTPAAGVKRVQPDKRDERFDAGFYPEVIGVRFESDRPLNLGPKIGSFDRIRIDDAGRHEKCFSLTLRGPFLFVRYKGVRGHVLRAVPVVGCVREIEFKA